MSVCCSVGVEGSNLFEWEAVIEGPLESPYEGGCFRLRIQFGEEYPLQPPNVSMHYSVSTCLTSFTVSSISPPVYVTGHIYNEDFSLQCECKGHNLPQHLEGGRVESSLGCGQHPTCHPRSDACM